jgi:hypothetical protein
MHSDGTPEEQLLPFTVASLLFSVPLRFFIHFHVQEQIASGYLSQHLYINFEGF